MSQAHDEVRALRRMVDELRAEPPPELPWDAIERRLLSRIDAPLVTLALPPAGTSAPPGASRPRAPARPGSAFSRVLGFAVAAGVLALGISSATSSGELPSAAAPEPQAVVASAIALAPGSDARDLSELHTGNLVEAGDTPLTFATAGLVRWTLAPGGALRVRSTGLGHTVALERGSLRAEVTPRDPSEGLVEAFAVEVAGTRVAVHGTAFSVERLGGSIIVDVEHGAVAVGPVGHVGVTTGHLLVGPTRASFSLDGGRSARLLERAPQPAVAIAVAAAEGAPSIEPQTGLDVSAPHPAVSAPKHGQAAHPVAHAADAAVDSAPAAPPEPPRLTVDVVRARLQRCFKQTSDASRDSGSSTLSIDPISTTLSITLNPDGTVRRATFSPTPKPELVSCAGGAISGRFPDNLGHVDIPVTFQP